MATSNNMTELARRFAIIAKVVEINSLKTVKRAAIAADQALILSTPVDTGRARANWLVSIATPRGEVLPEPSSPGAGANEALSNGRSAIDSYKLGGGGIFITNNLPYIILLEHGSSVQAPNGMIEAGIQAASRQFGDAKLLRGV